jgi:hypothetical protein
MQLDNPKRQRSLADVVASLPDKDRADVARRLANLDRHIARANKADADLVDSLLRILKSPHPQAQRLRELLKEIAHAHGSHE